MTNRETYKDEWYSLDESRGIKIGDTLYYARIQPSLDNFEVVEIVVSRIRRNDFKDETYIIGISNDKYKQTYPFHARDIDKTVFTGYLEANELVEKEKSLNKGCGISDEREAFE